jgi:AAA ATPase domain/AAA domain, putative AbiEii toxin, Type IV TA system
VPFCTKAPGKQFTRKCLCNSLARCNNLSFRKRFTLGETIASIEFKNYKALRNFSLKLSSRNVLVGPNNCGKSTIIGVFRVLAEGLRKARSKNPEPLFVGEMRQRGYRIPNEAISISTENIHTNYEDVDSSVTFRVSNGNKLKLLFPNGGGCFLIPETIGTYIGSPTTFKSAFPITLAIVPILGPLEHDEPRVESSTVQRNLHTTRASRHFRNYWRFFPEGFEAFSDLVAGTWPGMEITAPVDDGDVIHMFCNENRIPRELFWSGFGFQIWCQLLTHLNRGRDETLIVIDEPEIYLHPDLQRQLLDILFSLGPSIVIATHSAEIIGAAEPKDIVLVDKTARSAQRLASDDSVQQALDNIGSLHNVTLTRIARHRRVLFVEGKDYPLLLSFAKIAELKALGAGTELPAVQSDGFSNWTKIRDTSWGIQKILGGPFQMAAILDRDYRCDEEVGEILQELGSQISLAIILRRKELENYLILPSVLSSAVNAQTRKSSNPTKSNGLCTTQQIEDALNEIMVTLEKPTKAQYLAKRTGYLRKTGDKRDEATIIEETENWFYKFWATLEGKIAIAPGKEVLSRLREWTQQEFGVTVTTASIVSKITNKDIAVDLRDVLEKLDYFRTAQQIQTSGNAG